MHDFIYKTKNPIKTIKGQPNGKQLYDNYAEHTPQPPVRFGFCLRFCYPIVKS